MVTPFFHALWLLTVLGIAVFTAASVRSRTSAIALACGFIASIFLFSAARIPDPVWVGSGAAIVAALQVFGPRYGLASATIGGALAGLCGPLAQSLGLPLPLGAVFGAALAVSTAYLAWQRPEFAPPALCEQALLGILALATLVAVAPGVLSGWQSALVLNIEDKKSMDLAVPAWTLVLGGASITLGCLYSVWRHR